MPFICLKTISVPWDEGRCGRSLQSTFYTTHTEVLKDKARLPEPNHKASGSPHPTGLTSDLISLNIQVV